MNNRWFACLTHWPLRGITVCVCVVVDVFWYKEGAEVVQLEEDEHYDLLHKDSEYSLEIYNTSTADVGQYLCIAVNEQGQCNQSFSLKLEGN